MFIENAKAALTKGYMAWTVYAGAAAQLVFEYGLNSSLPWWVTLVLLGLILLARTVKQPSVSGPSKAELEATDAAGA